MRTIRCDGVGELVVRKSRFVCALARVSDEVAAREFAALRRREFWNASHNCVAYVVGEAGEVSRSSDDGEPSGTAGVPMLEVLRHRGLTNVVAVVTRWFGGVKLGAGGLVRAYGQAVSVAVDVVGVVALERRSVVEVWVDYVVGPRMESLLRGGSRRVLSVEYGDLVCVRVAVDVEDVESFEAWVAEVSAGEAVIEPVGVMTVEVEV